MENVIPILSIHHSGEPSRYVLLRDSMNVGRGWESDIVLPSSFVSRRHARLEARGGDFIISDASSTNGVYVNGRLLDAPHILKPGDEIRIADYVLIYSENSEGGTARLGEIHVDRGSREVWIRGQKLGVRLSVNEFKFLWALFAKGGLVCDHAEIKEAVWRSRDYDSNHIHRLATRLRQKLEPDLKRPRYIINLPGIGYRLERVGRP